VAAGRKKPEPSSEQTEFVITRVFNAPRELMFKLWTDSEHLKHWFGPKGFPMIYCINDLRPGGIFHYCLRMPNGGEMWGKWVYREIVNPERLLFVSSFSDKEGNVARHSSSPGWPLEMLSTITFEEQNGKTTVTVRWAPVNATAAERKTFADGFNSMNKGWSGTFEQLENYLAKAKNPAGR
jgi:uncharacterized protein YndB with AHSA1/START domain